MKKLIFITVFIASFFDLYACENCSNYDNKDFQIKNASVTHHPWIAATVWEVEVEGLAGNTKPVPAGQLNGAPVLGYVFPTNLSPEVVGFGKAEGILALALTSHPDFDDTPLWDESGDGNYHNDGAIWHPHWVVLNQDDRVEGGFSVKEFDPQDESVVMPPTNPGMPMYMDSPGFQIITDGNKIRVVVPDYRIRFNTDLKFDVVTCFMMVNTGDGEGDSSHGNGDMPMLGVYKVYGVASGDLSLPYSVKKQN
ncbi:MAG: hypothetical protein EA362_06235 [Saprospirales bacterium]|nr:MAG: hypothetical protein EA362_06235 [Saprospirales bacterium]